MGMVDEDNFIQTVMLAAKRQTPDIPGFLPAHISSYDPATNRVRCIIPSYIDPTTGEHRETGWVPLFTPMMGNGFGFQYAPYGGATQTNLQAGEQVWLLNEPGVNMSQFVGAFTYNVTMPPANPKLQAGELFIRDPHGSTVYWQADGTILISGAQSVVISGAQSIVAETATAQVTASQQVSITAPKIYLGSSGESLLQLVTAAMVSLFNGHTHPIPDGDTGSPNQQMSDSQLTSVVEAG